MGFKVRSFYVVAGSEEFPTGNTDALRQSRSRLLLTKCAQLLIDCGCGWQLDSTRSTSTSDFTEIPTRYNDTTTYPGLFFTNTISGCKLFMAYFGANVRTYGIKNFSGNDLLKYFGSDYHGGVCISMIPEGSESVFGDPLTTTFIPDDATRIVGTYYSNSTSSSNKYAAAYNPTSGVYYKYWIGATPYCVITYVNHYSGDPPGFYVPIYAVGRIFGTLAHDETTTNAKYGVFCFRFMTGADEGWATLINCSATCFDSTLAVPGLGFSKTGTIKSYDTAGSFSNTSGAWINGNDYANYNVIFYVENKEQLSPAMFNISGSSRWRALSMAVVSSDLTTYGVSSGDGFKGYLDTDLFRAAYATRGQTFDNGAFICPENGNNLIIGWDSSNDAI